MPNYTFDNLLILCFLVGATFIISGMIQGIKYQQSGSKLMNVMASLSSKYRVTFVDFFTPDTDSGWLPLTPAAKKKLDQILYSKDFDELPEVHNLRKKCLQHRRKLYQSMILFLIPYACMLALFYFEKQIRNW